MSETVTSQPKTEVLIAGAGPTGLVLALWLARLGVAVRIIDKTAEPGTTSRALAVQARTLELYQQIGIADAVVAAGVQVPGVNLWVKGEKAARVPVRDIGESLSPFPFVLIFQQDEHERLLIERLAAAGVEVERQTELVRFDQRADAVAATLRKADGSEEVCGATYLAGCDGAHSTVRQALGIGFPGGTYVQRFYVADVDAEGPPVNGELHVDLDEADFVAIFPLKGQGRVRLVGVVRDETGGPDGELNFDDVSDRAIRNMKLAVKKVNWFSTYHVHHRVADRFRSGRAFLLGDAAHIHSPAGGQGMNTGIGDAVNLAWKLAEVLRARAAESLLETYEPERIGFARRLVATTDRGFTFATKPGPIADRVRTTLVPLILPSFFRRHAARRFLFSTVSQIRVNYRGSALNEGRAGTVLGGDRLPWIRTASAADNFAALTPPAWQVHVYGDPRPGLPEASERLGLPLRVFPWSPEMTRAGLQRGATYLIRPDGYIALADPRGDPAQLARYFRDHGLRTMT